MCIMIIITIKMLSYLDKGILILSKYMFYSFKILMITKTCEI